MGRKVVHGVKASCRLHCTLLDVNGSFTLFTTVTLTPPKCSHGPSQSPVPLQPCLSTKDTSRLTASFTDPAFETMGHDNLCFFQKPFRKVPAAVSRSALLLEPQFFPSLLINFTISHEQNKLLRQFAKVVMLCRQISCVNLITGIFFITPVTKKRLNQPLEIRFFLLPNYRTMFVCFVFNEKGKGDARKE